MDTSVIKPESLLSGDDPLTAVQGGVSEPTPEPAPEQVVVAPVPAPAPAPGVAYTTYPLFAAPPPTRPFRLRFGLRNKM